MREIKFRAKNVMNGEWVCGDLVHYNHSHTHISIAEKECKEQYFVHPNTVGQFTGLYDKNGKEIYEGDIIQRMYEMEVGKGRNKHVERAPVANDTPKVIDFRDGAFGYVNFYESTFQNEEWLPLLDEQCEVIGNIYDNPELLKGGEK